MEVNMSTPTISASAIAKYFIWKAAQEGKKISNKKLQKLLYYAQAWHLVLVNRPLFSEDIEAWIHGPAVRSVYVEYKKFGFGLINVDVDKAEIKDIPSIEILDEVWSVYGKYDADYLEELTHEEDPWQIARGNIDEDKSSENVISLDVMKDYYSNLLEKEKQQAHG